MDLVPIKPCTTDSILISVSQRYDFIVEANAKPGNYWLRAGWQDACIKNGNSDDITGIIRYEGSAEVDPTTTNTVQVSTSCDDEPYEKLVPYVPLDVGNVSQITYENLDKVITDHFIWTINSSSLRLDWDHPTLDRVLHGESIFPTEYNAVAVEVSFQNHMLCVSRGSWLTTRIAQGPRHRVGCSSHPRHGRTWVCL